jgi:hypothetical protein
MNEMDKIIESSNGFFYRDKNGEVRCKKIIRNPYGINNNPLKGLAFIKRNYKKMWYEYETNFKNKVHDPG